jgi:hypothetical protein
VCQAPSCTDSIQNGTEDGVDCGGPCAPCPLYTFSGILKDVPTTSLYGWSLCYQGTYFDNATIAAITAACDEANLLIACREVGSPNLHLAANAPRADVLFDTGTGNTPHVANGVGWYFNASYSWGFAPEGAAINRNSCDLNSPETSSDERMCWHTVADSLATGYRCGSFQNPGDSYERLIFEAP